MATLARIARHRVVRSCASSSVVAHKSLGPRRAFAAGAHAKPEYTGVEATVRKYLPEDYQLVIATVSITAGLVFISTRGGKKKEEPASSAPISKTDTSIPSIISGEFEEWSKIPGNLEKWESSIEEWEKSLK